MPDPTVRSVATAAKSTANPRTVGKPAGLKVGDLLVLFAFTYDGLPSADPTGFTKLEQLNLNNHGVTLWTKTADAADVDATGFDIPNANARGTAAALYAVQNPSKTLLHSIASGTMATDEVSATGFDPDAANGLILCGAESASGGDDPVFSTTNNNPTWTVDFNNASYAKYAAHHATYASDAASGNVVATAKWGSKTFAYLVVETGGGTPAMTPMRGIW